MHSAQHPYIELHQAMVDASHSPASARMLSEWLRRYPLESTWLESFCRERGPGDSASDEDLWRLYALSRVIEVMNLSFQPGDGQSWAGPAISAKDVSAFATDLGLSVVVPRRYSPFDCEIVAATKHKDDSEPAALVDVQWPCLMLGSLLISRAGARVCAGASVMDPKVATSSTLYWAYRRRNRPHQDLSHGWGHNSQWRTRFRRDYIVAHQAFYNVDGEHDLASSELKVEDGLPLTRTERIELLTNRCFVVTPKPHDDLWPYDDRLVTSIRSGPCEG